MPMRSASHTAAHQNNSVGHTTIRFVVEIPARSKRSWRRNPGQNAVAGPMAGSNAKKHATELPYMSSATARAMSARRICQGKRGMPRTGSTVTLRGALDGAGHVITVAREKTSGRREAGFLERDIRECSASLMRSSTDVWKPVPVEMMQRSLRLG